MSPVSRSDKTSYCKISQSLEAVRFVSRIVRSPGNLTDTMAALSPMFLSNTMRLFELQISRIPVFTKSDDNRYWNGLLVYGLNPFAWQWKKTILVLEYPCILYVPFKGIKSATHVLLQNLSRSALQLHRLTVPFVYSGVIHNKIYLMDHCYGFALPNSAQLKNRSIYNQSCLTWIEYRNRTR